MNPNPKRGDAPRIVRAEFVLSVPKWKTPPGDALPQICFAGRSNVGKSSLINAITNVQKLARTSSTPGRTQALVLFRAEMKGTGGVTPFHLVDLPGFGFAKVPLEIKRQWRPMMSSYFDGNDRLACCVFLLDIRRDPSADDMELLEMMEQHEVPTIPVVTKADKVPKTQRQKRLREIASAIGLDDWRDLRPVSVQEKFGIQDLVEDLDAVLSPPVEE